MYVFSNGKKMDEYANELKDKFGYGDDLAFEITTMAESIIDYLGEEYTSIVLDAISQVKVVLVDGYRRTGVKETISDVLEREGLMDASGLKGKQDKDLRNIEGMYCERPHFGVKDDGSVEMTSVDKVAIINSPFVESDDFRAKLARELLKAVKSHLRAYELRDGSLTISSGLSVHHEKIAVDENNVNRTYADGYGAALEDGLNNYSVLVLMRNTYNSNYDLPKHTNLELAAGILVGSLNLGEMLKVAEITKVTDELIATIEKYSGMSYEKFLKMFDVLRQKEEEKNRAIGTDSFDEASLEYERYFTETIAPVLSQMAKSMNFGQNSLGITA